MKRLLLQLALLKGLSFVLMNSCDVEAGCKQEPFVSVLIPVYNTEKYLKQCLDSLVSQTFTDFEAICINDGSTDSSRAIIQSYTDADGRFSVIDKPNSGYGASMNQGLRAARGKYLAVLESDDFFEPDALEALVSEAESRGAQVVKADFWLYWSTPQERKEPFGIVPKGFAGRLVNPQDEHAIFYKKPSIWSALYDLRWLRENDIFFLETPGASYQDASFNFKVWLSASKAVFIDRPVLFYRQDNEQSSVNSPSKVFCVCDEYEEMERYLKRRPAKYDKFKGVKERMKVDSYLWNYDRLSDELRSEFLPRAVDEFRADVEEGLVDWSLLEFWAEVNLRAMLESPDAFVEGRAQLAKPGKFNTFKHYYRLGGWPLVLKVLKSKSREGES